MKLVKSFFILFSSLALIGITTNAYFSDTAIISSTQFQTGIWPEGHLVINEVYYDVAGDKGTEDKNEWIELYNNSDSPISLKNWSLSDLAGNIKPINPEVSIPAKGFVVLSHDNSTWSLYWTLPAGVGSINLTGSQAWLNNDGGDKLILKNAGDNEVDWVAWENGVAGWNINANEGQSIQRSPVGTDTDTSADWVVNTAPSPGLP